MKKILTASLVAIMAVTAANADIASTKYVNTQTGLPENQKTFAANDFAGVASGKTNLKDAVNAIAQELNANLGENGTVTEQIDGAVEDALGTLPGEATTVAGAIGELKNAAGTAYSSVADAISGEVGALASGAVKDNADAIEAINNPTAGIEAKAKKYTDEEILKLDANTEVAGTNDGSYVTAVAQADGKITVSTVAFDAALDANSTNAVQNKVVNTAITGIKTNLGGLDGKNIAAIPDACKEGSQGTCSLVMKNGQATWEVVEY